MANISLPPGVLVLALKTHSNWKAEACFHFTADWNSPLHRLVDICKVHNRWSFETQQQMCQWHTGSSLLSHHIIAPVSKAELTLNIQTNDYYLFSLYSIILVQLCWLFYVFLTRYRCHFATFKQCQEWVKRLNRAIAHPSRLEDLFALAYHAWCLGGSADDEDQHVHLCRPGQKQITVTAVVSTKFLERIVLWK